MGEKDNDKKNIIMVVVDALRPKNLSLFGYNKETDKNLKKIAKESLLFKKHFSTSNATTPSLGSIFTGLYPNNHGIMHQFPYTKEDEIKKIEKVRFWLPSYLKNQGYETIAIDWIDMFFKKGFDYYGEKKDKKRHAPFDSAKDVVELAISKIKESKKPFFLFMHFWDTHFPFPNTEYESKGDEKDIENTLNNIQNESQREYLKKRIAGKNLYTIQDMINKYDLAIKGIDNEIGNFYEFLKKENLWDNIIFIFLGDHGDNLTEHGIYFSHSGLYDDSVHSPLIIKLPGISGKEINELVQPVDIVPTILDYLRLEKENKFDGSSLIPLIKNKKPIRNKVFLFDGLCKNIKAVRTEDKKLIIAEDNFCYLCKATHHEKNEEYDLKEDPQETKNIFSGKSKLMEFFN